jgi:putative FmdB family regulatory protein
VPIFAYQCPDCGHTFDALQKVGAEALSECPNCSGRGLRKLLSAPNFHLKGKGWRKSEAGQKDGPPAKRPRFTHTFDSPTPHSDHHDHGHSHDHAHDHGHSHGKKGADDHKH